MSAFHCRVQRHAVRKTVPAICGRAVTMPLWRSPFLSAPSPLTAARMSTVVQDTQDIPLRTSFLPPPPPPENHKRTEHQRSQYAKEVLQNAVAARVPRHDWTREEIAAIYYQPLMELSYQAVSGARRRIVPFAQNVLTDC